VSVQQGAADGARSSGTQGANAVEIKVTVRTDQEMYAVRTFNLDDGKAQERQVYYFDTPELTLFDQGLILRARLIKNDDDDSTIKIRPVEPARIADRWRSVEGFKLEGDIVGSKVVRSASLTTIQKPGEVREVLEGKRQLAKLFSADQERFLTDFGPTRPDFATLKVLGPVQVLRWKFERDDLPYELTAEEWRLPDVTDLLELSIKVAPEKEEQAMETFHSFLHGLKLDLAGEQQAKTRVVLQFFAEQA
jgi:hypothetical protein